MTKFITGFSFSLFNILKIQTDKRKKKPRCFYAYVKYTLKNEVQNFDISLLTHIQWMSSNSQRTLHFTSAIWHGVFPNVSQMLHKVSSIYKKNLYIGMCMCVFPGGEKTNNRLHNFNRSCYLDHMKVYCFTEA